MQFWRNVTYVILFMLLQQHYHGLHILSYQYDDHKQICDKIIYWSDLNCDLETISETGP